MLAEYEDVAVAVAAYLVDEVRGAAVGRAVRTENIDALTVEAIQPVVGSDPHEAVLIAVNIVDCGMRESLFRRERLTLISLAQMSPAKVKSVVERVRNMVVAGFIDRLERALERPYDSKINIWK